MTERKCRWAVAFSARFALDSAICRDGSPVDGTVSVWRNSTRAFLPTVLPRYSSPELDAPPYDFFRLPFLGGPAETRLMFPVFGLPRPLPAGRPASPAAVRLFRPALPPFIVPPSRVPLGADGGVTITTPRTP